MTGAAAAMIALASTMLAVSAAAQTSSRTPIKGVGVDERLDAAALLEPALTHAGVKAPDVGTFVRVIVPWSTLDQARTTGRWDQIDARLDALARLAVPVLLEIEDTPLMLDQSTSWSETIRAIATHGGTRIAGFEIDVPRGAARPDPRTYAYFLKQAAVQVRSVSPNAVISQTPVQASDANWQNALYANDIAPVVDIVPIEHGADTMVSVVRQHDPTAVVLATGLELGPVGPGAARRWLTEAVSRLGETPPRAASFTGSADAVETALIAARDLKDLLAGNLLALDPASVSLTLLQGGTDASARVPHRLLFNAGSGSTYFVYWGLPAGGPALRVSLVDPSGRTPTVKDVLQRRVAPVARFTSDPATHRSSFDVPSTENPIVVDFNDAGSTTFVSSADVSTTGALSVDEIILRHQEAEATRSSLYSTYSASLETRFHFRPSATQIFDVVSENRVYASRDTLEWEELSFSVNGAKWGSDRPAFPLLQAEKVLSRPLDLRLTTDYRYRLAGIDTIDEHRCYAIDFDPVDETASRFRGRVWIDTTTFLRVKLDSVQTHLDGPIVSSEVSETYAPVATVNGKPLQFATHMKTRQLVLIAGRTLLVEKDDWYSDFSVDAPDFAAKRSAARASDHIMYRDTDRGVRYLVKRGGDRVVSEELTRRSKALAMGTRIDPAFDFPLPIFGINYLNFDVLGTNSQLAMLFGGVFIAGNVQKPRLGRTPFDGSIDFYGIAVPATDKIFTEAGEDESARVMSIPASTGLNAGWQFTPFQKVTVGYQLLLNKYFAPPNPTGPFTIPTSTVTHGLGAGYEFKWRGYTLAGTAATRHRMSWDPWGHPGDYDPSHQNYQLYSAGAAKDFLPGPFQAVHVGVSWFDGRHLDRFSMYQFDWFSDVQMHGVPSAGVRFPALVLARASYSLNLFDQFKLDCFLDQAFGRDPIDRAIWRPVTGTGAAVTFRAPWNTLFTADVGKSFLPALYRSAGSFILQIMLIKPL